MNECKHEFVNRMKAINTEDKVSRIYEINIVQCLDCKEEFKPYRSYELGNIDVDIVLGNPIFDISQFKRPLTDIEYHLQNLNTESQIKLQFINDSRQENQNNHFKHYSEEKCYEKGLRDRGINPCSICIAYYEESENLLNEYYKILLDKENHRQNVDS